MCGRIFQREYLIDVGEVWSQFENLCSTIMLHRHLSKKFNPWVEVSVII